MTAEQAVLASYSLASSGSRTTYGSLCSAENLDTETGEELGAVQG